MRSFSGSADSSKWNCPSSHDLAHLRLHALPQVLGREGPHLHEHAPLPLALGEGADGGVVLLHRDLALADEELPQAVVGEVAGGEHHLPVLEVQGLARAPGDEGQDARALGPAEVLEDVRHRQLGELALEPAGDHERLYAPGQGRRHQRRG
jgi:hypothetical protein